MCVCPVCNKTRFGSSRRIKTTKVNLHIENVSFDEQKHCILINNNVREDGTLINDKNKVEFTIGNSQLNDNNMNNVGSSKSFFRMDQTYEPTSYDTSNKVLSLSQSQSDQQK